MCCSAFCISRSILDTLTWAANSTQLLQLSFLPYYIAVLVVIWIMNHPNTHITISIQHVAEACTVPVIINKNVYVYVELTTCINSLWKYSYIHNAWKYILVHHYVHNVISTEFICFISLHYIRRQHQPRATLNIFRNYVHKLGSLYQWVPVRSPTRYRSSVWEHALVCFWSGETNVWMFIVYTYTCT